jgi:hypothetical protein
MSGDWGWVGVFIDWALKILALVGGLFGGIPRIHEYFTNPRLSIEDVEIYRIHIGALERTVFQWRVLNNKFLGRFGKNVNQMIIKWTIYLIEDEKKIGDWGYSGEEKPVPLLPLEGGWHQEVTRSDEFPPGQYRLHLTIFSGDKLIHSFHKELHLTNEFKT